MTRSRLVAIGIAAAVVLLPAAPAAAATGPPAAPPIGSARPAGQRPGPAADLRRTRPCGEEQTFAAGPRDETPERMQLGAVHQIATGQGQTIAVIDTGVSPSPALGERLRGGGDYLTGGAGLEDCDGHGTAVAGLIAARGTTGRTDDVVGVAPDARIIAIRQLSGNFEIDRPGTTSRSPGTVETLADAVVLAVREGAGVINISQVSCMDAARAATAGDTLHAALHYAATAGVVVVAAAGNIDAPGLATDAGDACQDPAKAPDQVALPGWYDEDVLTVGAAGPDDAAAGFTVPGPWVDVAAPGTGLRSLAAGGGDTRIGLAGTSFAAPLVAGLAALVRQRYPELSARQVMDRIVATARRPAGVRTAALGRGVIDPLAALTAVPTVLDPDDAPQAREVPLPGTTPTATTPDPGLPLDLAVLALVVVACVVGVGRLRRA